MIQFKKAARFAALTGLFVSAATAHAQSTMSINAAPPAPARNDCDGTCGSGV